MKYFIKPLRTSFLLVRTLLVSFVCIFAGLGSCSTQSNSPETHFLDYQKRLARILDVDIQDVVPKAEITTEDLGVTPPRKRLRMLPLPENELSLFDFLRLENCEIKRLVAERNNQLGKHMQAANGILYEINVRRALADCIPRESSATLKAQLEQALVFKQQSVGLDIWQYSFGSDWFGRYANTSVQPLAWNDTETLLASIQAWQVLNSVLINVLQMRLGKTSKHKQALNDAFQTLEISQGLGRLQASMVMVINELEKTNQILLLARPSVMCSQRSDGSLTPNKKMNYVSNVVTNYFAKDIQVYLAQLNREGQRLISEQRDLLDVLERHIDTEQPELSQKVDVFRTYQTKLEQTLQQFQRKIREHVVQVQKTQQLCQHHSLK